MRKLVLALVLCLVLTFGLAGASQAAPIMAGQEGGTVSLYVDSLFGLLYFGGVTLTIADGVGAGIGTMLNEPLFLNLLVLDGTLTVGPVLVNVMAGTDAGFDTYFGIAGAYLKLQLGPVNVFPGAAVLFFYYDNGVDPPFVSNGDLFGMCEFQLNAGNFTFYGDVGFSLTGGSIPLTAMLGMSYSF